MHRAHTPPTAFPRIWPEGWHRHIALHGLLAATTVGLSAQPSTPGGRPSAGAASSRPFRHYPDGKDLPSPRWHPSATF